MAGQKGGDSLMIQHRLPAEAWLGWIFQAGGLVPRQLNTPKGSVALMPLRRSKSRSCDHQAASGKSLATKSISFSTPVLQLSN